MKQIYVGRDRMDADLACKALRDRGFQATVMGDPAALPTSPFPSVWVEDDEEAAARAAWEEIRAASEY